jgi:uncharacterized membrane protein
MQNIININSANILTFGFASVFSLSAKTLTLDITDLTSFQGDGAAAVQGIFFEVKDPSGMLLASIDYTQPAIIPATQTSKVIDLLNGFALFGVYTITGVIRDENGRDYPLKVIKEICMPEGFKNGAVPGKFDMQVDCDIPIISITDLTVYAYKGLSPVVLSKSGLLFYPKGSLADLPFTYTPFTVGGSGKLYTGRYTLGCTALASYELGDGVVVKVLYSVTGYEKVVTCTSKLKSIVCCLEEMQEAYDNDPYSATGRSIALKIEKVSSRMMQAIVREKSGKDASALVADIARELGCDCGCGSTEAIETRPILAGGVQVDNIAFAGKNAVTVTAATTGSVKTYTVDVKNVTMTNQGNDLAIKIRKTETATTIAYDLSFDYDKLASSLLQTIKNSDELTQILKEIVGSAELGYDLSGLDGKCVLTIGGCSFSLIESNAASKYVTAIEIDGTTFNAPTGLQASNAMNVSNWLNNLGKGAFNVSYDSAVKSLTVTAPDNENVLNLLTFTLNGNPILRQFSSQCTTLSSVLQALINYMCALTTSKVLLGSKLSVCVFDGNGKPAKKDLTADATLANLLGQLVSVQCELVNKVSNLTGFDCAALAKIFSGSAGDIDPDKDVLYGRIGEKCAPVDYGMLAEAVLTKINKTATLKELFCELVNTCSVPVCDAPTNLSGYVDNGDTCAPVTGMSGSASA